MVKLIKGQNDLLSQYPDCINEWDFKKNHPLSPDTITAGSSKKVWWICSKGHSYEQSINLHIIRGYSCPYCSHQKVFAGYNDLETLFPDIAKEWHPSKNAELTPSNVTAYSQKKVWWLCPMGHSYEQTVERRVRRGSACYYCSGHKVLKGFNDLASVNPSLSVEWHPSKNAPLTPYEVTAGSGKRVWWLCPIGHEYQATIHDRNTDNTQSPNNRKRGIGCPCCSGRVPKTGVNDLETLYPELLKEWNYERNSSNNLFPSQLLPKSGKKAWWKCSGCGHEWYAVIASRVKGHGCPHCSKRRKK